MGDTIFKAAQPVTLVGGAPSGADLLGAARQIAPVLVAADGGADTLLAAGLRPDRIFGDMDSISAEARAAFAGQICAISDQVTTDFDKALRHLEAPLVVCIGVTGGRFDHELATLGTLLAHPAQPAIVLGARHLVFLVPPDLQLRLQPGTEIGLFPMAEVTCASEGLVWPTDGLTLAPWGRLGTSNETQDSLVRLRPDAPRLLAILPPETLPQVARALTEGAVRWP